MTIYKPNNPDRKQEKKLVNDSTVVIDDSQPLTEKAKEAGDTGVLLFVRRRPITNTEVLHRRRCIRCIMVLFALILVVTIALMGALFLRRHMNRPHMGICQVMYHNSLPGAGEAQQAGSASEQTGSFSEQFEVDDTNKYERLQVPPILNFRRSTVVHDFEKNLTAIVDRDHSRCYVLPLNRVTVQPPANFIDLMEKFQSGYYLPNAEIVRENYKVQTPPMEDLEPLGLYIWSDCQYFDTYRLVKDNEPIAMSKKKRSAISCAMAQDGFCLGASSHEMTCISLTDCF